VGVALVESCHGTLGAVYLRREQIMARVFELGTEVARDYVDLDPFLVAPIGSNEVFLADLTAVLPIPHAQEVVEISHDLRRARTEVGKGARLLKAFDLDITGRHVLIVDAIVDTGLTLHFLCKTLALRQPASLAAVTLLDRPYRRLIEDIPLRDVGFKAPDFLFAGYGLGPDGRRRGLRDLHVLVESELSSAYPAASFKRAA
jgi:hypoxanthine phosphoribosyltransferase